MDSDIDSVGIITGTGLYDFDLGPNPEKHKLFTPFGPVWVQTGQIGEIKVALIPRHGSGHHLPPHKVNYRANILAFKQLGVRSVLSTAAVGSLNLDIRPGDYCVVDDFIDLTKSRPFTLFEDEVRHTDFSHPYCPRLKTALTGALKGANVPKVHPSACYVCVEGPRYETPAEIRAYSKLGGDIIGMTNATEAIFAREAGLCFGTVAVVTNMGTGLSTQPLTHEEVSTKIQQRGELLQKVIIKSIELLPTIKKCPCQV